MESSRHQWHGQHVCQQLEQLKQHDPFEHAGANDNVASEVVTQGVLEKVRFLTAGATPGVCELLMLSQAVSSDILTHTIVHEL